MALSSISRKVPLGAKGVLALGLAIAATIVSTGLIHVAMGQVPGQLVLDQKSKYSHLKVTRDGDVRTLWFVRANGQHVVESKVDLSRPDDLLVEYTRFMFLSYVFNPQPKRALIVGLGGGSMVHFLKAKDPGLKVDVVEIDPLVVSVADRYFGVRTEGNVDVKVGDGLLYLKEAKEKYDVIYMDAFLRPSAGTDLVGVPSHLKTEQFYDRIARERLNPDGVVVFNLNPHPEINQDIRTIKKVFPNTYVFRLTGYEGYVVVATTSQRKWDEAAIGEETDRLDARFNAPFLFHPMAKGLQSR